jgi:hypothetical protein
MIIHVYLKVNLGVMEIFEIPSILNKMLQKIQFIYQPECIPYFPFIKNKWRN